MMIELNIFAKSFDSRKDAAEFEDAAIKVISDEHPDADLALNYSEFTPGVSEIVVTLDSGPDADEGKRLWVLAEEYAEVERHGY